MQQKGSAHGQGPRRRYRDVALSDPAALVLGKPQAVDLPKFDLDAFFILHKGNLAVVHEAQAVLADAIHEIARVSMAMSSGCLPTRGLLCPKEPTEPAAALANAKAVVEQSASVTKRCLASRSTPKAHPRAAVPSRSHQSRRVHAGFGLNANPAGAAGLP